MTLSAHFKKVVSVRSVVILGLLLSSLAIGQVAPLDLKKPLAEQVPSVKPDEFGTTALEGPVEARSYTLGPGDKLVFQVWGDLELLQIVSVGADGYLSIPTIGDVYVAWRTLFEADSLVKVRGAKVYPRAKTGLKLIAVRSLKASISGAVETPGSYSIAAVDRLSALVNEAGGFIEPPEETEADIAARAARRKSQSAEQKSDKPEAPQDQLPSKRHIRVEHKDGSSSSVDFLRFERTGDAAGNPTIRDGDKVFVPFLDRDVGVLSVFGAVKSPGEYEFRAGDRLRDLFALSGGLRADASLADVTVVRFTGVKKEWQTINVDVRSGGDDFELLPDDRVIIKSIPDFRSKFNVKVTGEVPYPGTYPINDDSTTLTELIAQCGGFTKRADLPAARVLRRALQKESDPEYDRLLEMTATEMSDMEYEYFKTRSRTMSPAVVVDFRRLFEQGDRSQDVTLRDGDEIVIPIASQTVNVIGQVQNPGLTGYAPGKGYEYYIQQAGGFAWNARKGKLRLIKARTGRWVQPTKDTVIEVGDTIFVPEKKEIETWELWKDLLLIASQIATIVLVLRSV